MTGTSRLDGAAGATVHLLRLALALAWLGVVMPAAAGNCSLQPVTIQPATAEPTDTYVGRTDALEVRFHNDRTTGPIDVFPEPPLTLKQLSTANECVITEGGVWVRRHVYASNDGRVLVTHEYSGSNDELVFYDARNCSRQAAIDVSGTTWRVDGGSVLKTPAKAGGRPSRIRLDAACLPPAKATGSSARR